jgi:alpha-beta hydrolase superfamily lysophospholipase
MRTRLPVHGVAAAILLAFASPASAQFSPGREARNYSKINERAAEYSTPEYQAELRRRSAANQAETTRIKAEDPERNFDATLCGTRDDGCAGDVRLYDWEARGHGLSRPVLFTARNGAVISGHVWATRSGPAKRPGIVITDGSVQAPEQLYWFAATNLAKRGYVVLTFDPQGQGRSDVFGEGADADEGVPAQQGRPFYDNTEDALDFFFSTPSTRYRPVKSCTSGTDHSPKQERRVREGRNAANNPLWQLIDRTRVGIAGHSFGAAGVSFVGQRDPRVKAIVGWDNLSAPAAAMSIPDCASAPATRKPAPITKAALGMSADYFLTPQPYTSNPDPTAKSKGSLAYTKAGVDTGELIIRGGTHYEFSYIPNPGFGATLRGMDLVAWYTAAWFDKYVKGDPTADSRLTTDRWRDDRPEAAVDPDHDGNQFSFYYPSRLDIRLAGGARFRCENLGSAAGCALRRDCEPVPFSYLALALSADTARSDAACPAAGGGQAGSFTPRCLPRTLRLSTRGIGRARLGRSLAAFNRRYAPVRRGRLVNRYCVRGGGRFVVGARRGRISLVASAARHHRSPRLAPGKRPRAISGRRVRGGLFAVRHAGVRRLVYGVRRGRVRFVGAAAKRDRRLLVRRVRAARF